MLTKLLARIRGITRRRTALGEADDELAFHLAQATDAYLARGASPDEARRLARRDLGGLTQATESIREVRALPLGALGRDVHYAFRALAATPRFTTVALLTTILMVGGITTIFAMVNAVLLRPLPYPDAGRLLVVTSHQPKLFGTTVALPDIRRFQRAVPGIEAWGLYRLGYLAPVAAADGRRLAVQDMEVSSDLFPMLGLEVVLGRPILPSDSDPAAAGVAVISDDLWQSVFGRAGDVIGRTLHIRNLAVVVVGVAGPAANVPLNWLASPIVWRPIPNDGQASHRFSTLARRRADVSQARAAAAFAAAADTLAAEHPQTHAGRTAQVTSLLDSVTGGFAPILWVFFGTVSCVLLIGGCNLVSLQLARNGDRSRELSLRAALGASRARLVRQLVVESVLLAAAGGLAGLATAWLALRVIVAALPSGFPRTDAIGLDLRVALFAAVISLVVGVVVGLASSYRASRVDLASHLNDGGRGATPGGRRARLQRALIAVETATALALLIAAALLATSFERLLSRNAGMREEGLLAVSARLPTFHPRRTDAVFWGTALHEIRALPGVDSAAVMINSPAPLSGFDMSVGGVLPEIGTPAEREGFQLSRGVVSGDYFATLGMPLIEGRPLLDTDTTGSDPVVVINELAARTIWPGETPLGKRLKALGTTLTVVGVIPTFRHAGLEDEPALQMYTSYRQGSTEGSAVLMIRTARGRDDIGGAVGGILRGLEGDLDVTVATLADLRWKQLANERFRSTVLIVFAATAVFLALVGIFGLVAYSVGQRQREIAVRVALGAVPRNVVGVVLRQVMSPAAIGLAGGLVVAALATRLLTAFLIDVEPTDLATFAGSTTVLAVAALLAGLLPARRALHVNPVDVLRAE